MTSLLDESHRAHAENHCRRGSSTEGPCKEPPSGDLVEIAEVLGVGDAILAAHVMAANSRSSGVRSMACWSAPMLTTPCCTSHSARRAKRRCRGHTTPCTVGAVKVTGVEEDDVALAHVQIAFASASWMSAGSISGVADVTDIETTASPQKTPRHLVDGRASGQVLPHRV